MPRRSFGGGGGGGGAPAAHAPSHEAGGSDPITNLGTLVALVVLNDGSFDRAKLDLDGSGLTLYGSTGDVDGSVQGSDGGGIRLLRHDGSFARAMVEMGNGYGDSRDDSWQIVSNDEAGLPRARVEAALNGDEYFLTFDALDVMGNALANITVDGTYGVHLGALGAYMDINAAGIALGSGVSVGVLGATPYGQDAFLADPDVSGLVAWAAAINSYLIARGWMASS